MSHSILLVLDIPTLAHIILSIRSADITDITPISDDPSIYTTIPLYQTILTWLIDKLI